MYIYYGKNKVIISRFIPQLFAKEIKLYPSKICEDFLKAKRYFNFPYEII